MQYLNKTFMGAQRIYVEFAERYGGSRLPRAWSKYTQGTSGYNKLHAAEEGPEKKLGVRELKKLRKKEREAQHPEEGATVAALLLKCLLSSTCPSPSSGFCCTVVEKLPLSGLRQTSTAAFEYRWLRCIITFAQSIRPLLWSQANLRSAGF